MIHQNKEILFKNKVFNLHLSLQVKKSNKSLLQLHKYKIKAKMTKMIIILINTTKYNRLKRLRS